MTLPLIFCLLQLAASSLKTPNPGSKLMNLLWSYAWAVAEATCERSASRDPSKYLISVCCYWWHCNRSAAAHSFLYALYQYFRRTFTIALCSTTSGSSGSGHFSDVSDSPGTGDSQCWEAPTCLSCLWLPCIVEKTFLHTQKANSHIYMATFSFA